MSRGKKTVIPFQKSSTVSGTGLPGAAETVTLFNSVVAFGPKAMPSMDTIFWISYTILVDTNATGNSLRAQFSDDGGVSWTTFFTSVANNPVANTVLIDELFIGQYQDVRFQFINGAAPQTSFKAEISLDAERSSANLP